ncbi:GGDEF domain-containing protein [Stenotrophomonas sp. Betaine-02u-21]|nr:GGDEF domain-containing protein [Stenotrophomonas sp. Betaine-02u-23]PKH74630.1 GGDEF domain-containing protein [Stenotrophomonas sp. Betaine-02u-21]PKH95529.1 GGDEF domain-containing protein [Stenotrophomonas sp. Bg11-02]
MNMADSNALVSLSQFARTASGADLAIVVEVQTDGRVAWSTGFPVTSFSGFNLARSGMLEHAWNDQPVDASRFRLPTSILTALGGPAGSVLFIPAPSDDAPSSGLLLLWKTGASPEQCAASMALLGPSVAQLLSARRGAVHDIVVRNQFIDLVESVPAGIVLVDGDGLGTVINQRAAELLGHKPGRHRAVDLVAPMRALRQRCDNHEALEQAYAAQVGNLNFATTLHWVMGERTFEVDTHPVRGDGEQGRIWLFTDITADLLMAAELRRLASSDPLTGVPNRRHFEERSAQIIAAREATGRSVAVLMLDVDHFKKINDTHGHPIGDEVLKVVARRCREALRERDLFARFGGEEFIALLAAPTADEVPATAERLRNAISGAPVHVGGLRIDVTVSVGGAMGEALPGSDARLLEQLVARADEALYQAKADGRNRVRMSG